jgi:hypothetical protein
VYPDVHKFVPHRLLVVPAICKHYEAFNGFYKDINVYLGNGAFREKNFDELHNAPITLRNLADSEIVYGQPKNLYDISVPIDELPNVKEYSFSFYFRWNYINNYRMNVNSVRGEWLSLAGVTETGDYSGGGWGDRTLAIWNWPWHHRSAYHFTTYNYPHNGNQHQEIDYSYDKEFDGVWNFVYFGYSSIDRRVYAFMKFGSTGRVATLNWNNVGHTIPPRDLKFMVGRARSFNQVNGRIASIKWNYQKGAFIGDENLILNSYIPNFESPKEKLPLE